MTNETNTNTDDRPAEVAGNIPAATGQKSPLTNERAAGATISPRPADNAADAQEARPAAIVAPIVPMILNAKQVAALTGATEKTIGNWNRAGLMPMSIHYPSTGAGKRAPQMWLLDELKKWIAAGMPNREQWERAKAAGNF